MPSLQIGGEKFLCRENLPAWQLMKLAKSMKSGSEMDQVAGMYDFVVAVVEPAQRARFDAFMDGSDVAYEEFNEAIGALMEQYAPGRPTERSSASPPGPKPSGGTSRVVSLSRGTVETETSSPAGASAAS